MVYKIGVLPGLITLASNDSRYPWNFTQGQFFQCEASDQDISLRWTKPTLQVKSRVRSPFFS